MQDSFFTYYLRIPANVAEKIGKERILRKRRIKESILIDQQKRAGGVMNNDRGWELSKIWLGLF